MYDFFPGLTTMLASAETYATYVGIALVLVSFILAGIRFLPIWGEDQRAIGIRALGWTFFGGIVILLAPHLVDVILHFFPVSSGLPQILPATTPTATPRP